MLSTTILLQEETQARRLGLQRLTQAFEEAGFDYPLSLSADQSLVFSSTPGEPLGYRGLLQKASEKRVFLERAKEIRLAICHETPLLRLILESHLRTEKDGEIAIHVSARPLATQIRQGETAQAYAERMKAWAADPRPVEEARLALQSLLQSLTASLQRHFPTAALQRDEIAIRLPQTTPQTLGNFRNLRFGSDTQAPHPRGAAQDARPSGLSTEDSRPSPRRRRRRGGGRLEAGAPLPFAGRAGRQAPPPPAPQPRRRGRRSRTQVVHRTLFCDPYDRYFYDPYAGFANYVLLQSILYDHAWHLPYVYLLDPWGSVLGSALYAGDFLLGLPWFASPMIAFEPGGSVWVDEHIPFVSDLDHGFWGDLEMTQEAWLSDPHVHDAFVPSYGEPEIFGDAGGYEGGHEGGYEPAYEGGYDGAEEGGYDGGDPAGGGYEEGYEEGPAEGFGESSWDGGDGGGDGGWGSGT